MDKFLLECMIDLIYDISSVGLDEFCCLIILQTYGG